MVKFRWLTAGESHGKGLSAIIEGIPAGLEISEELIASDLLRRQGGYGRGKRQQIEQDRAEIISGVRHGKSIGSPIALTMINKDHQNANWQTRMSIEPVDDEVEKTTLLRPGHADLVGTQKYGFDDVRPILERSSARETAARVAVGAVARTLLRVLGIEIRSHTLSIGNISAKTGASINWSIVEKSPVRVADKSSEQAMIQEIDAARTDLDTLGGVFEVRASGLPMGLGSHVHWDLKLDGLIAQAVMSINAVKAVEIGEGIDNSFGKGSEVMDVILPESAWELRKWERMSNRAGGLEAGITNGQDLVVRGFLKPISTVPKKMPTADLISGKETESFYERSDVCVVPAGGVVGEAMVAIVLANSVLEKFGGDSIKELTQNFENFQKTVGPRG
ncbi:MAG: chorismate synthase [Dehalococcoidia bacterium]|jgi:chorismate synthase|nr:chorismate synthase [Dehalococcoidia bacterium]|tara:strand:+ start:1342 stop:2514 length:1173 start_codon:yes stop_codon:yes gene_type:complete